MRFSRDADFTGATFSGPADFERAIFRSTISFVNAEMKGPTSFEAATFSAEPRKGIIPLTVNGIITIIFRSGLQFRINFAGHLRSPKTIRWRGHAGQLGVGLSRPGEAGLMAAVLAIGALQDQGSEPQSRVGSGGSAAVPRTAGTGASGSDRLQS